MVVPVLACMGCAFPPILPLEIYLGPIGVLLV